MLIVPRVRCRDHRPTQISRVLAPAEEVSPFKLGQIQKLIADMYSPAVLAPRSAPAPPPHWVPEGPCADYSACTRLQNTETQMQVCLWRRRS
jgi:hypothetical protein